MVVGRAADPALCELFWRGHVRERGREQTRLQVFTRMQRLQRLGGGGGGGNAQEVVVIFSKPCAKAVARRLLALAPVAAETQRLRSAIAQLRKSLGD